jgi:pimeloyl-ACP methyl ester carboxylesterase
MALATIVVLALLAHKGIKHATASPILDQRSNRPCTTFTIPVPIIAHNHVYDIVHVDSNIDATNFAQDIDTWDNPDFSHRIVKDITISKTYDIHAQLCVPPNGAKKSSVYLATHGGVFDSRYWDAQVEPKKHNFVEAVLEEGYSILIYDRLACGKSDKPDAYTDVQAPAEVEILRGISELLRSGKISKYASNSIAFDKIIHVGHSYGSFVTYAFTSLYPDLSDAVVLTGFINSYEIGENRVTAMGLEYAPENDPKLFGDFGSGYVVPSTKSATQTGFFSSRVNETTGIGGFEPKLLDYAFSIRQPNGAAALGSALALLPSVPTAPQYTGPVQFMLGEFDFLICLGDCRDAYNATLVNEMYPKAKGVDVYLQPGTGHGLPFHNNAQLGFRTMFDWLHKNGF